MSNLIVIIIESPYILIMNSNELCYYKKNATLSIHFDLISIQYILEFILDFFNNFSKFFFFYYLIIL